MKKLIIITVALMFSASLFAQDIDKLNRSLLNAAEKGDLNEVISSIENGADVNAKRSGFTDTGFTALMYAALGISTKVPMKNYIEIVIHLIEKDANVDIKNNEGRTALMYAAKEGHIEIAKLLIENTANIEKTANIDAKDNMDRTALMHAAGGTSTKVSREDYIEIVKELLNNNADPGVKDKGGRTALMFAAKKGHIEIAKLLIKCIVNFDKIYADAIVKFEAKIKVRAEALDTYKATREVTAKKKAKKIDDDALYAKINARNKVEARAKALVLAYVNAKDKYNGKTVLMFAAEGNSKAMVKFLIEEKTVLMYAAEGDSIKFLIECKTALMYAAENGHIKIVVEFLIENRADITAEDKNKKTALDYAKNALKEAKDALEEAKNEGDKERKETIIGYKREIRDYLSEKVKQARKK